MPGNIVVTDADNPFIIDSITKTITNASGKTILMQYDNNSESFTFIVDKLIDGHDMSTCDKVDVHYYVIDSATRRKVNASIYPVPSINDSILHPCNVDGTDNQQGEKLKFSWVISNAVTNNAGSLCFLIAFSCLGSNNELTYRWSTNINSSVVIAAGMDNTEETYAAIYDTVEDLKDSIDNVIDDAELALNNINASVNSSVNNCISAMYDNGNIVVVNYATHAEVAILFETSSDIVDEIADSMDQYTASNGIQLSGSTFSLKLDGGNANGLEVTAEGLKLNKATQSADGAMSKEDKVQLTVLGYTINDCQRDISDLNDYRNADINKINLLTNQLANANAIIHETVAQAVEEELTDVDTMAVPSTITVGGTAYPVIDNTRMLLSEVRGKTVIFNQFCNNVWKRGIISDGVTFSIDTDFGIVMNGTANGTAWGYVYAGGSYTFLEGHRYVLLGGSLYAPVRIYKSTFTELFDQGDGAIGTPTTDVTITEDGVFYIGYVAGHTYNNQVVRPQLFDLTLMFGAGNEPATVEEFKTRVDTTNYFSYDTGTVKSVKFEGVKVTDNNGNETALTLFTTPQELLSTDTLTIIKNTSGDLYTLSKNETVITTYLTCNDVTTIAKQGGTISIIGNDNESYGTKPDIDVILEVKYWREN